MEKILLVFFGLPDISYSFAKGIGIKGHAVDAQGNKGFSSNEAGVLICFKVPHPYNIVFHI